MKRRFQIYLGLIVALLAKGAFAQYPQHFVYNDENGLPSNEVYSLIQDYRGFIWLGCDAGLFKYDGVRYTGYKAASQHSKSITDLTLSSDGVLYCVNFQDQIFYLENDSLKELKHSLSKISNISVDSSDFLYVCHSNGISLFNAQHVLEQTFTSFPSAPDLFTRSVNVNQHNEAYFIYAGGVGKIYKGQQEFYALGDGSENIASKYFLALVDDDVWVFSRSNNNFFTIKNDSIVANHSQNLRDVLENKKVTGVKWLKDGNVWITTYKGVICYDIQQDSAQILYPHLSFSSVMIDREENYWFSTLQTGVFRAPNLNSLVWNSSNEQLKNDKLTHITDDGQHVYFSAVNGYIGRLNTKNNALQSFYTGKEADIESFDYDFTDGKLYFSTQGLSFSLKNDQISQEHFGINFFKSLTHGQGIYVLSSSQGLYVQTNVEYYKICNAWCRESIFDKTNNRILTASNDGLIRFSQKDDRWVITDTLLNKIQVLSLDFDDSGQRLFYLSFDGQIFLNDTRIFELPSFVQAMKLEFYRDELYVATNKGVWIYRLENESVKVLDRNSGLASNNVQDLLLLNDNLWLATGLGLQKIPLHQDQDLPLAKLYLKGYEGSDISLEYEQSLKLYPEVSLYSSNGNIEYAYRIQNGKWVTLPSSVDHIEIQHLPIGNFEVELKTIDHLGRDSENSIHISGYVNPPFWLTWWFIALVIVVLIVVVYIITQKVISDIRNREHQKNELLNSQLKAIRAQMNPHFMYNTLNSIQDLILHQDIKSTNYYLSQFSQLMRQILTFSEEEKVLLVEEVQMLNSYLELEKLRFGKDFLFEIVVDESVDAMRTFIPSLVVQPFVENAIKHGLLHKKGGKSIKVRFSQKGDLLEIVIEDNGVGRRRSDEIKKRSNFSHKSFASNAVQKRIELLNKSDQYDISIIIEDLRSDDEDSGTKVSIKSKVLPET